MKPRSLHHPFGWIACLVFVVGQLSLAGIRADDWPHWRGPDWNDRSAETGLLQEWPADGPQQLWINQEAGLGYAGFSIVGDQLFTLGLENEQEFALCLNAETGEEIWRTPVASKFENSWGDGPRSTPSVDGDHVYALFAGGMLACLKKKNGAVVWKVELQDFGGKVPNWGFAESPLVDEGNVICTPGGTQGTMLALNKRNGRKIWQSEALVNGNEPLKAHYSSILPVDWNGQRQYVQLLELAVVGVSAKNGTVLWQRDWPGRTAVIPSPIFDDGLVYVTSGYSIGSKLIEIGKNNRANDLWFNKELQNHHGGVIQVGDYYYGSSAQIAFVCQEQKSGRKKWADRDIKKGALGYADNRFYHVQEDDGKVLLFAADENGADLKGSFVLAPQTKRRADRGKIWVHPVISHGRLYLRDQEIIYCYDVKKH